MEYRIEQVAAGFSVTKSTMESMDDKSLKKVMLTQVSEQLARELVNHYPNAFKIDHEYDIMCATHIFRVALRVLISQEK